MTIYIVLKHNKQHHIINKFILHNFMFHLIFNCQTSLESLYQSKNYKLIRTYTYIIYNAEGVYKHATYNTDIFFIL